MRSRRASPRGLRTFDAQSGKERQSLRHGRETLINFWPTSSNGRFANTVALFDKHKNVFIESFFYACGAVETRRQLSYVLILCLSSDFPCSPKWQTLSQQAKRHQQ